MGLQPVSGSLMPCIAERSGRQERLPVAYVFCAARRRSRDLHSSAGLKITLCLKQSAICITLGIAGIVKSQQPSDMTADTTDNGYLLSFATPAADTLQIILAGSWQVRQALPATTQLDSELKNHPDLRQIRFDSDAMTGWDSALLTFLSLIHI